MNNKPLARMLFASTGVVALLAGVGGPAAAVEAGPDGVDAKTPLVDYVQQVYDFPGAQGHKYSYSTTKNYWSVVAIEMPIEGDVDLAVYGNKKMNQLLETSALGGTETDFVAVDSNRRELSSYYPKVATFSGDSAYVIELAQGADQLGGAAQTIPVTLRDVVVVRDTFLTAGTTYMFTATPSANVDPDLFLMSSNPRDPDTWVQRRLDAVRVAASNPTGTTESFMFTPGLSQWYGVVVTFNGGDGSVVLARGIPAPGAEPGSAPPKD